MLGCGVEGVRSDFSLIMLVNFAKSSSFKIMFGKYSQKHTQIKGNGCSCFFKLLPLML
jgi:hypothetical protein